ncbi:hypothetical protein OAD74_05440 [Alphaproteobacteria bacterium]|nr:hypothetical protein [Alphaproteobacteria bacterium]
MPVKIMANYCQFITSKRSQPRPFPAPFEQDYRDVAPVCRNSSSTVCKIAGFNFSSMRCKSAKKKQPQKQPMKRHYFPILICAGPLVSGSIITGIANADMDDASHKRGKLMAKKLDINNDGVISLEELISHLNGDGMIDKTEFNSRIVAMFKRMDSNDDVSLDGKEIIKIKHHQYGKMKNKTGGYSN